MILQVKFISYTYTIATGAFVVYFAMLSIIEICTVSGFVNANSNADLIVSNIKTTIFELFYFFIYLSNFTLTDIYL